MNAIDVLVAQTKDAHGWTNKLIDSIPFDLWNKTPNTIASNISWQVGHLIISEHYHAILVILGFQQEIMEKIPLRAYGNLYAYDSVPADAAGKIDAALLREQLGYMQEKVIKTISGMSIKTLSEKVAQPIKMKHPVAISKFDAVSWNIKHTMWHCGQIATLKRVLHGAYDFGLPKRL